MRLRPSVITALLAVADHGPELHACEFRINSDPAFAQSPSLKISSVAVEYQQALDGMVFSMNRDGPAGKVVPKAAGQLHGAPVLAYIWPTSLKASAIGMGEAEGIVALGETAHPDFDDTPLWDEDGNGNDADDKVIYHTHWV